MDDPQTWQWVWLLGALVFAVGEMANPGTFFLAPFAVGALAAAGVGLLDAPLAVEWAVFVAVSIASLFALRPLARRLDRGANDDGIGARRLLGQEATVVTEIPGSGDTGLGLVRVGREEWRAESTDGSTIPTGAQVRVADIRGTRVVVSSLGTLPSGDGTR